MSLVVPVQVRRALQVSTKQQAEMAYQQRRLQLQWFQRSMSGPKHPLWAPGTKASSGPVHISSSVSKYRSGPNIQNFIVPPAPVSGLDVRSQCQLHMARAVYHEECIGALKSGQLLHLRLADEEHHNVHGCPDPSTRKGTDPPECSQYPEGNRLDKCISEDSRVPHAYISFPCFYGLSTYSYGPKQRQVSLCTVQAAYKFTNNLSYKYHVVRDSYIFKIARHVPKYHFRDRVLPRTDTIRLHQ